MVNPHASGSLFDLRQQTDLKNLDLDNLPNGPDEVAADENGGSPKSAGSPKNQQQQNGDDNQSKSNPHDISLTHTVSQNARSGDRVEGSMYALH